MLSSKISFLEFAGAAYELFCDYTQAPIVEVVVNGPCSADGKWQSSSVAGAQ